MPLKMPFKWKTDGCGVEISAEADKAFDDLINIVAEDAGNAKSVYETMKSAYGNESVSTSTSWAKGDMGSAMTHARPNAARYIASFYNGMESLKKQGHEVPETEKINEVLLEHEIPLAIEGDKLVLISGDFKVVTEESAPTSGVTGLIQGEEIGRGGFGIVYEMIRKTQTGEYPFAMKVLDPSSFTKSKEKARERFEREMKALGKLQHRGIVQMLETGLTVDQKPYILMPLIRGRDVRRGLSGMDPPKYARVFDEILSALAFAHRKGVIHRDLKPSNILIRSADKQAIILDFGCAYLMDDASRDMTTTLIGSSPYVPMEVHRDPKHRDVRQDVYACGVVLYECIAQRLPHPDDYEPLEPDFPQFSGIDKVIQAALAPERKRIATANDMREALDKVF